MKLGISKFELLLSSSVVAEFHFDLLSLPKFSFLFLLHPTALFLFPVLEAFCVDKGGKLPALTDKLVSSWEMW